MHLVTCITTQLHTKAVRLERPHDLVGGILRRYASKRHVKQRFARMVHLDTSSGERILNERRPREERALVRGQRMEVDRLVAVVEVA